MEGQDTNCNNEIHTSLSTLPYYHWVSVHALAWCPPARYKHAATVVDEKLYIIGGCRNGRYLSDIQVFDLRHLKWFTLKPKFNTENPHLEDTASEGNFPACAGHSVVHWDGKLIVIARNTYKPSDIMTVWSIDLQTYLCNVVNTFGRAPITRGGHSVTLVGSKLILFGGEDSKRRLLNDLHVLDLETMTWDVVETKGRSPSPRFDHSAAIHADNYLLIFGGSSHSTCYGDLHVLELQTMEWSQPNFQGADVMPRGGHACTTVDEYMYVVGGGDNKKGLAETLVLNMSKLVFSIAAVGNNHHPLASEGLTLSAVTIDGQKVLIAFGGYNGRYHNEVYLFRPKPRDLGRPRLFQSPAAAAAAASVTAAYALATMSDNKDGKDEQDRNIKNTLDGSYSKAVSVDTDAINEEKKNLESRLIEVRAENTNLTKILDEINSTHSELSVELQSVENQLMSERSRCTKLETQIAEMQKRLESLNSIEQELELLRRQKTQLDYNGAAVQRRSGGVWRWGSGAQDPAI